MQYTVEHVSMTCEEMKVEDNKESVCGVCVCVCVWCVCVCVCVCGVCVCVLHLSDCE